ncbi:hypothetical protein Cantr_03618 [Candida viswanathii]|uniref:Uncharacterized protein n=1 Tax=Candida viswanathii TaxID=5486 RepID=A0A367XRB3_9ASCO|nr:hypothetical protein Cantr_03618 [Candida viswanathii]
MQNDLNIDLVVQDIGLLYSSHDAAQIQVIQERLQSYQKSEAGYQLALQLLARDVKNVRYFGALTITVFLNTRDSHGIYSETFDEILRIMYFLVEDDFAGNLFIIKKLLSNLSLLYVSNYDSSNFDPVERLTAAMLGSEPPPSNIIGRLQNEKQLEIMLLFLSILVEDIIKIPKISPTLHALIHSSIFKHCQLLYDHLAGFQVPQHILNQLLDCLSSWVVYISVSETQSQQRYTDDLQVFIMYLLKQFNLDGDESKIETLNKVFTVVTEIIDHIPRILTPFKSTLFLILFADDSFGVAFIKNILSDLDFREMYSLEIENFVNLIISYLTLNMVLLTRNILDDVVFNVIQIAVTLTNIPGIPMEDEKVSDQFTAFWEEFTNTFIDDAEALKAISQDDEAIVRFNSRRDEILKEVAQIYFKKINCYPRMSKEFRQYRASVADMFILLYSLLGVPFYSNICDLVSFSLLQPNKTEELMNDLESGLYLIFKITEDIYFYDDSDAAQTTLTQVIDGVFSKNLVGVVQSIADYPQKQISITLLNLMSSLSFFYKNDIGSKYLPYTFNFLFNIILNNQTGTLSLIASRTVYKICQDSEEKLIPFLPNLEMILVEMLKNPAVDNLIRERMTNSYISVARSTKNPIDLGNRIHAVLLEIDSGMSAVNEELEEHAISLVSCVSEMSRASAYPEEIEDYLTPDQLETAKAYWTEDPLGIRNLVLNSLNSFSLSGPTFLLKNATVTEKCCVVLKSGLREEIPGPFTFATDVILQYLISKAKCSSIQSIATIESLVESVIITHGKDVNEALLQDLLETVFANTDASDVDSVASALEMFTTILERKPGLLLRWSSFDRVISFALHALSVNAPHTLQRIIKFFNTFITLKRGNSDEQQRVREIVTTTIGNTLVEFLFRSFVLSPRSGIDHYYPLFRTLVAKFPRETKEWILMVLSNNTIGKAPLDAKQAEVFVNKLLVTRGQRQAQDVLKDYWLQVNKLTNYKN